jgi:ABC-2 type transport system ATP-binding protein
MFTYKSLPVLADPPPVATSVEETADVVAYARGVWKRYGEADILRGVDLEVRHGEVLALLGPNGAGKTTLLEILEGFREPSAGTVRVMGAEPARGGRGSRERVGVALQDSRPEPGLTVRECLALYAGYYQAPRGAEETLGLAGLETSADVLTERLSGGELRRLDLALALVGNPDLLFLDEPTTGFDPVARRSAWRTIRRLAATGTTILLTTHLMDEAERLADRIAVLVGGRIVTDGPPEHLAGREACPVTIRFAMPDGEAVTLRSREPLGDLARLVAWARARALDIRDLEVRRPTLEDVYLRLIEEDELCR